MVRPACWRTRMCIFGRWPSPKQCSALCMCCRLTVITFSSLTLHTHSFSVRCPAFKLLTYYGGVKERAAKRQGWSKPNAFHVCITSYTLVLQVGAPAARARLGCSSGGQCVLPTLGLKLLPPLGFYRGQTVSLLLARLCLWCILSARACIAAGCAHVQAQEVEIPHPR